MEKNSQIQFEQPSEILIFFNRYLNFVVALLIIIILFVGYFFVLAPKIETINEVRQSTTVSESEQARDEALLRDLRNLQERYQEILNSRRGDLEKLTSVFPKDPGVAELFILTDKLAKARGFQMLSVGIAGQSSTETASRAPIIEVGEDGEDVGDEEESSAGPVDGIRTLQIQMTMASIPESGQAPVVIGQEPPESIPVYEAFKLFLDDLESNLRLMDLQSVNFDILDEGEDPKNFGLNIITYYRE